MKLEKHMNDNKQNSQLEWYYRLNYDVWKEGTLLIIMPGQQAQIATVTGKVGYMVPSLPRDTKAFVLRGWESLPYPQQLADLDWFSSLRREDHVTLLESLIEEQDATVRHCDLEEAPAAGLLHIETL